MVTLNEIEWNEDEGFVHLDFQIPNSFLRPRPPDSRNGVRLRFVPTRSKDVSGK